MTNHMTEQEGIAAEAAVAGHTVLPMWEGYVAQLTDALPSIEGFALWVLRTTNRQAYRNLLKHG